MILQYRISIMACGPGIQIHVNLPSSSMMETLAEDDCNGICPLGLFGAVRVTVNISSNSIKSSLMIVIPKHCGINRLVESKVRVMTAGEEVHS